VWITASTTPEVPSARSSYGKVRLLSLVWRSGSDARGVDHPKETTVRDPQGKTPKIVATKVGLVYVRSAAAAAFLVPLAALLGGVKLSNHNETLVRV
jgi:hypothetical protein